MNDDDLYNSRIIKTFVEYLGANYPGLDINPVLDHSGMTVYQLNDEGHWFNQTQVDRFHDIVLKLTGNSDIALEAGRYAPFSKASGAVSHYVAGLITPGAAYSVMGKLYHQVSRACILETRTIKNNQIDITVKLKPGIDEKPYQCVNRRGSFEGIAKLLTGKLAHIDHPVCLHQGGDRCQYLISWEQTRSSAWKRLCYFATFASGLLWIALMIAFSGEHAFIFSSISLLMILIPMLRTLMLEKRELGNILHNSGQMAENLLDQINVRYSNAVLIKEIGQYACSILDTEFCYNTYCLLLKKISNSTEGW